MSDIAAVRRDGVTLGIATMVATAFAMSFGDALVKQVSADLGLWQIFVLRSLVALPMLAALLAATGGLRWPGAASAAWATLRSLLLLAMWITFYAALTHLDLATVASAYYTGPLFITLLSSWIARERVGAARWLAVLVAFAGVLLILRPDAEFSWLALLPVLSGFFYALAAVVTRTRLAGEAALTLSMALNGAFLLAGILATAGLAILSPGDETVAMQPFLLGDWRAMGAQDCAVVVLLAVLIVVISTGVAKAYQSAPSSIIATFDYSYLPFAVLWGFAFFGDVPDAASVAGMLLIGGAGVFIARSKT